jgi:hypothetical protein
MRIATSYPSLASTTGVLWRIVRRCPSYRKLIQRVFRRQEIQLCARSFHDQIPLQLTPDLKPDRKRQWSKQPRPTIFPHIILHFLACTRINRWLDIESPQQSSREYEQRVFCKIVACANSSAGAEGPVISEFHVAGVDAFAGGEVIAGLIEVAVGIVTLRVGVKGWIEMHCPVFVVSM